MTEHLHPPEPPKAFTLKARHRTPTSSDQWHQWQNITTFDPGSNAYMAITATGTRVVLPYEHWDIITVEPA